MSAREVREIATVGCAQVLGRTDCGSLEVGKRADIAIWDMTSGIATAGAWDPVAALVLTGPHNVRDLYVEGHAVVRAGHLTWVELGKIVEHQNRLAAKFI